MAGEAGGGRGGAGGELGGGEADGGLSEDGTVPACFVYTWLSCLRRLFRPLRSLATRFSALACNVVFPCCSTPQLSSCSSPFHLALQRMRCSASCPVQTRAAALCVPLPATRACLATRLASSRPIQAPQPQRPAPRPRLASSRQKVGSASCLSCPFHSLAATTPLARNPAKMTLALLRLPLLLALLALSLTEAALALAIVVIPALPVDPLQHAPTSKPATAAGVLVLGGLLAGAWSLCAQVCGRCSASSAGGH